MTVKIRLPIVQGGIEAQINNWEWTSDNPKIAQILNNLMPPEGPETTDPDPDLTQAKAMVKSLGGKIISATKPKFRKDVIY